MPDSTEEDEHAEANVVLWAWAEATGKSPVQAKINEVSRQKAEERRFNFI